MTLIGQLMYICYNIDNTYTVAIILSTRCIYRIMLCSRELMYKHQPLQIYVFRQHTLIPTSQQEETYHLLVYDFDKFPQAICFADCYAIARANKSLHYDC